MTASDTLWALAGVGAVVVVGYVVWKYTQDKTTTQQQSSSSPLVTTQIMSTAAGTASGVITGYNYSNSAQAWGTSSTDIMSLAYTTQSLISSGISSILTPITAPINALGGWLGSVI